MAGISLEWTRKEVTSIDSPIHSVGVVLTLGRELEALLSVRDRRHLG